MPEANDYDDDYGTCHAAHATLRIARGEADPATVTARLGLAPTMMKACGQAGAWRDGEWRALTPDGRVSPLNIWNLSTEGVMESRDSLRHIDHLLALLKGKDAAIASLQAEGWKIDIAVFWDSKWGHGGPTLTPSTMRRLAELGITIWYDVYFSKPDRAPEEVEGNPNVFRIPV